MLHIYRFKDEIPETLKYVKDNYDYFMNVTINKLDSRADGLTKMSDGATYLDRERFTDKFGVAVPWSGLSMGGMTVLNVFYNHDCCFDMLECGYNTCTDIKNLKVGNVFPGGLTNTDNIDEIDVIYEDDEDYHYTSFRGIGE